MLVFQAIIFHFILFYIRPISSNNSCRNLYEYPYKDFSRNCRKNQDVGAPTDKIIKQHGYKVESHFVTTPDGHILQLFRIPPNGQKKQPVFIEPGILSDSSASVFTGNNSLALNLAKDGYDVWLSNPRGSPYSRGHKSKKITEEAYWNFTLDTSAAFDIPTALNKVWEVTQNSIIYMGHSRGTHLCFMYILENQKEAEKLIRGIIALSPTAYLEPKLHIRLFLSLEPVLNALGIFKIWALFQYPQFWTQASQVFCPFFPFACKLAGDFISGSSNQFLPDDLLNLFSHFPSSFSLKQYIHTRQMIETGRLQKFDYGKSKNLETYGQEKPPVYDLRKIKIPVYMFYGLHDVWVTEQSVKKQFNDFGSAKKKIYKIPIGIDEDRNQFAHNDVFFGANFTEFVYKPIVKILAEELQ